MYAVYHDKDPLQTLPTTREQPVHTPHTQSQQLSHQNEIKLGIKSDRQSDIELDRNNFEKNGTKDLTPMGSGTGTGSGTDPNAVPGEEEEENDSQKGSGSSSGSGSGMGTGTGDLTSPNRSSPYKKYDARVSHMKVSITPMYSKVPIGRKVREKKKVKMRVKIKMKVNREM